MYFNDINKIFRMPGRAISIKKEYLTYIISIVLFACLYVLSLYSYLLYHSIAEIFSVVIAVGIFMVAWNSRKFMDNNYLLFIGIAYFSISLPP